MTNKKLLKVDFILAKSLIGYKRHELKAEDNDIIERRIVEVNGVPKVEFEKVISPAKRVREILRKEGLLGLKY